MGAQRDLEVSILAGAIRVKGAMAVTSKLLNGYEFSDDGLGWIWQHAKAAQSKGEVLRLESLEAKVLAEPDNVQDAIMEVCIEVWKAKPSPSPKTDIETLKTYHKQDSLVKAMDRAAKAVNRGDVDGAGALLQRAGSEATATDSGLQVSAVLDFDEWNEASAGTGIETGLRTFDEITMGGPRAGDVGIIMGVTGMGKSQLGLNFGYNAFKRRRRVLHIDSENGLQETRVRYIARATRLPARALTRRGLDYSADFKLWAGWNTKRIHDYLRILHIGVEQASMEEVEAKIAELCADNWAPELIIFDTPDHVIWSGSMDNSGLIAKVQHTKVKSLAQRYNAVMWSIIQAKPEAEGRIATNKHTSWGYAKAQLADIGFSINPGLDDNGNPMSEKEMGSSRCLFVSKARKSPARFIIPLKTDFATAYITEELDGDKPSDDDE